MNALPQHIADELQDVHDQIMRLSVRVGFLLDRAGIDVAPPPRAAHPGAPAVPATVTHLDTYRASRGA